MSRGADRSPPSQHAILPAKSGAICSPDVARSLVSLMPKARLEVFRQAKHLVWLDAPEAAGESARAFLDEPAG
jgi:pimeloyl-ACP methyl ester carboxylesterase